MKEKITSLREQQKEAVREQLIYSGMGLFLKQGFTNTTVDQIVEPLGIAKRTFFRYFNAKEEVVSAWQMDKTEKLVALLNTRPADDEPLKMICDTISSLLDNYDAMPSQALAYIRLTRETPALIGHDFQRRVAWEHALSEALSANKPNVSLLEAKIITGSVMSAWAAAIDEWVDSDGEKNLRQIASSAFAMLERK